MSAFPEQAKVVIIGLGGIVGASVAHHLIVRGWDDIVGIDKSGIPTDIGSTAHASDFCYTTSHDFLSCWTTLYSIGFYERMGHYARIGGLEVARVGDDVRMNEIRRKTDSAKAFGTRARLIDPAEIKKKFPLIEEELIQGGLWDPDAGLVISRSQMVAGKLVDQGVADGKLQAFANTSAKSLVIEDGRIKGVVTTRGTILADHVVVCAGLWGRLIAEMAGEDLPLMPVGRARQRRHEPLDLADVERPQRPDAPRSQEKVAVGHVLVEMEPDARGRGSGARLSQQRLLEQAWSACSSIAGAKMSAWWPAWSRRSRASSDATRARVASASVGPRRAAVLPIEVAEVAHPGGPDSEQSQGAPVLRDPALECLVAVAEAAQPVPPAPRRRRGPTGEEGDDARALGLPRDPPTKGEDRVVEVRRQDDIWPSDPSSAAGEPEVARRSRANAKISPVERRGPRSSPDGHRRRLRLAV